MRIAQIAPMYECVPPARYGGTERVVAALCDGLVELGHDVTLFAAAGSKTRAVLVPTAPSPLRMRMSREEMLTVAPDLHRTMLAETCARAADFDIIHAHTDVDTLADVGTAPTVVTLHGRLDLPAVRSALTRIPRVGLVSISRAQREPLADLSPRWLATVPNGLDLARYERQRRPRGDHLLFVGRIHPEKGIEAAIEIARRTNRRLVVAAKVDPMDLDYFARVVEPAFTRFEVDFLGEVGEDDKPALYASASATLFPSDWPEPFGLVMIESLAAGTPVIALRRGSVPEILTHGVSGLICDDVDAMEAAVARVHLLDPDACRREARNFTAARMASDYVAVYEQMLRQSLVPGFSSRAVPAAE